MIRASAGWTFPTHPAQHAKWIRPLPYKKVLIRGNHDRKSANWYLDHGWDMVCDGFRLEVFGKKILFTHVPQKDDGWFDLNIHGHFHNSDHRSCEPEFVKLLTDKHILLSLENTDYKPVLLEKLI